MTKTSKTIVFFGNERLATGIDTTAPTLQALIDADYSVAAVVSHYESGQSRKARVLEIDEVAKRHNIPVLLPEKPVHLIKELAALGAEVGVLIAYGKIVPQSVIDIFPKGIVNIHPSLLPLHRGPTPIESVILDGSNRTGVSIMALSKEMDAGPVYAQSEVDLHGNETKQALAEELLEIGGSMLLEVLPGILDGSIVALPQDESRATYDNLIIKMDGLIDWHKPAFQLEREIRAFADWPKSRTELAGKEIVITAAKVVNRVLKPGQTLIEAKQLIIGTSEQSLAIGKLKPAGKAEMSAQAFLAGYKV
ncbi:MAG: methionyl-tRNA formyltransferase [Candidatus Saccharibacteria bacterium]